MTVPCTQSDRIAKLEQAMFGDPKLNQSGMVIQVKEIHDVLLTGNVVSKTVIWVLGGATTIIGIILGIMEITSRIKNK